jgi:hypothetical protein
MTYQCRLILKNTSNLWLVKSVNVELIDMERWLHLPDPLSSPTVIVSLVVILCTCNHTYEWPPFLGQSGRFSWDLIMGVPSFPFRGGDCLPLLLLPRLSASLSWLLYCLYSLFINVSSVQYCEDAICSCLTLENIKQ